MKKIFLLLLTMVAVHVSSFAQKPADLNKAVVNVISYDADGNVLHSAYGFLFAPTTDCADVVAPYQVLKGAYRAEIVDWKGQRADVLRILGASSEYDLVTFSTSLPMKKGVNLWGQGADAAKGQAVQVAYYTTDKKALPESTTITAADVYNEHHYYEVTLPNEDRFFGCPLINTEGRVVGMVQKNVQKDATTACAIDIDFAHELSIVTMSALNSDLNAIKIPKALPKDKEDAASYLYMLLHSAQDSTLVITATNDYFALPGADSKVYAERASYYAGRGDLAAADADLKRGISAEGDALADIYHTQSVLMYNKVVYGPTDTDVWPAWTLDSSLESAEKAYAINPLPVYLLQQGHVLFTQQKYQAAYEKFIEVTKSDIANYETFYYAANALERAEGAESEVIALLDSAVARLPRPFTEVAAPYLLARAQHLDNTGQHRRATADFNDYEKIVGTRNLNAYFYYLRMQSEIGSRMYQQALDDAGTAISRATTDEEKADYLFERACLQLQVNLLDDCIASCEEVLKLAPSHAEAYKICGVAYGEKKQKTKAAQYLQKAVELNAENASALLEKYK